MSAEHPAANLPNWKVTVNELTKIVPAPNVLVAMHRGIERSGVPDGEIQKLVVSRV